MRKSILLLLALALLLPTTAGAQGGPRGGPGHMGPRGPHRAEVEQRIRTMRAVALANRLELDEETALRMNAVMRSYDDQREALRGGLKTAFTELRDASQAEKPDAKAVDGAVQKILDTQARMSELRREELEVLMKNLDPKRRAQLVLFYREFPREIRRMLWQGKRGAGGMGPPEGGPDEGDFQE